MSKDKKNITIGEHFVVYNTKTMRESIVKIPSYLIEEVLSKNKKIIIQSNKKTVAVYDIVALKKNIMSVERTVYDGWLNGEEIQYNLALIKV